jgi:uncharacterized protein (DUF849 family)
MPLTVDEIVAEGVACAAAGAAILHYHSYDTGGRPSDRDLDFHRRVVEGIRSRCNAVVYPTTTMRRCGEAAPGVEERFAVERALADEGLLEWFVLDPGSTNIAHVANLSRGFVYVNDVDELVAGYELAKEHGLVPVVAVFELGFARLGKALAAEVVGATDPGVYRAMFSDGFAFGLPPGPEALHLVDRALRLLGVERWMVAGVDFDVLASLDEAVTLGADVRVGLEDAPRGCEHSNVELVREVVARLARLEITPATADEVRGADGL